MTARTVNTTSETYTLTTTAHDTITVTPGAGAIKAVRIINLDATTIMWCAGGRAGQTVPTATAGGSNCHPAFTNGGWWAFDLDPDGEYVTITVDVVGNGNQYTVEVDR
jgi:hypothetical protein